MKHHTRRWLAGTLSATMLLSCTPVALGAPAELRNLTASYRNVLNTQTNRTKIEGEAVYDKVLDLYESYFQDSIRFRMDGKLPVADITGQEWYRGIEIPGINRERAKAQFISYQDAATAFAAEKSVLDTVGAETSSYYKKLSGQDWDFALVTTPEEAAKKDAQWLAQTYSGNEFQQEYVPAAWQTYRNPTGTFLYDEPMYTNHGFPWEKNIEAEDYKNPDAPTAYNPVGYYRTTFTLEDGWKDREIFLSLQSVESAYYLYVNGKPVGYSTDSFTAHDFNITPYLQDGENTIALKVFRWSIGSWLENQDFIRQSGIYRDVYLYSKGEAEIRDFFVKTQFTNPSDLHNSDVDLQLETTVRGLKNTSQKDYTISARLLDQQGQEVAKAKDVTAKVQAAGKTPEAKLRDAGVTVTSQMNVTNPEKWYPDTPNLYYVELVLKDAQGKVLESVVERVGFRDVRKVNLEGQDRLEQIQINGKQMVLRGVNRHDTDSERGHAVGYEEYLRDLTTMKQHNLNAIRTSHYPNDEIMYDLADELGLYICSEANIESHRAAFTGDRVPTGQGEDRAWVAQVLDRNANMIERYKNHPSVVIWSSNNEAQYLKVNYNSHSPFWVASMYALRRDPSRLRKSERSSAYQEQKKSGDQNPWSLANRKQNIVDLHSTQYALPDSVQNYQNYQPFVHSEYNHAMGQSLGNAKEHWDVIRSQDYANGGFIWDYIDQSIRTVRQNEDGTFREFWGYGGDWIDETYNDDAFCGNGLVYADGSPSPKIREAKKVHQQINFYLDDTDVTPQDTLAVKMVNEYENTPVQNFDITWSITRNGTTDVIAQGKVDSALGPFKGQSLNTNQDTVSIALAQVLPQTFQPVTGEDYFLNFSVVLKEDTNWGAKAGFEVAHEQFTLNFEEMSPQPQMDLSQVPPFTSREEKDGTLILTGTTAQNQTFQIVLNTKNGTIDSYQLDGKVVMTSGPEQSIYRAQTYNDTTSYWDEDTLHAGAPENLKDIQVTISENPDLQKVTMTMTGTMKVDASLMMTYEIYGNGEILVLDQFFPHSDFASKGGLPKVGSRMIVSGEYDTLTYYGRGPWDTYVDRNSGAKIDVYSNNVADSFDRKMLKPQENGNHTDVRWTSLTNQEGEGLLVSTNGTVEVSALHYTAEELNDKSYDDSTTRHPDQVPMRDQVVWSIDYKQRGVSDTAFMGHRPLDGYQVPTSQSYSYSYRITPITAASKPQEISDQSYRIAAASTPVTSISINGTPLEGFSPLKTEYTYSIPFDVPQLQITAAGVNTKVVDHRDGTFTISGDAGEGVKEYTLTITRQSREVPSDELSALKVSTAHPKNPETYLTDGKPGTFWETDWSKGDGKYPLEQLYVALELKQPVLLNGLRYLPRQDGNRALNGALHDYEIYVSSKPISELFPKGKDQPDLSQWTQVSQGSLAQDASWKELSVPAVQEPVKTVLLQSKSTYGNEKDVWMSGAELRVTQSYDASSAVVQMPETAPLVDGEATPVPVVTVDGKTLIDGVDFTVTYANHTKVGSQATAVITFQGAFEGTPIEKSFTVGAAQSRQWTITLDTQGGTPVSPIQVEHGTPLNPTLIPEPTREGYRFGGWWNYNFTQAFDFSQPVAQHTTLYAKWDALS